MTITAAADGSALGNPGPAGWAWYVDDNCWAAGGWRHGTNNMGELMAVLDLLRQTADVDEDLHVLCDSQYVINVITKWMVGWKRKNWRKADGKPVLNVELIKALHEQMQGRRVTFEWVRGHAGHELNEAADELARAAASAYQAGREPLRGPGFGSLRDGLQGATGQDGLRPPQGATQLDGLRPPQGTTPQHDAAQPLQGAVDDFRVGQIEETPALFALDPEDPELDDAEEDLALPGDEPVDPDPDDLFGPVDVPGLDADVTEVEHVIDLERALLTDVVRSDPSRVAALTHPDWFEVGTSGRIWNRGELLAEISPLPSPVDCEVVDAQRLAADQILLLWRSTGAGGSALRTSLWICTSGNWQQRFHQATPES